MRCSGPFTPCPMAQRRRGRSNAALPVPIAYPIADFDLSNSRLERPATSRQSTSPRRSSGLLSWSATYATSRHASLRRAVSWPEQAEGIENGRMSRTRSASPPHRQHHRLRDLRPVLEGQPDASLFFRVAGNAGDPDKTRRPRCSMFTPAGACVRVGAEPEWGRCHRRGATCHPHADSASVRAGRPITARVREAKG